MYYRVIINSGGVVVHIFLIIIACHCCFVLGIDCNKFIVSLPST